MLKIIITRTKKLILTTLVATFLLHNAYGYNTAETLQIVAAGLQIPSGILAHKTDSNSAQLLDHTISFTHGALAVYNQGDALKYNIPWLCYDLLSIVKILRALGNASPETVATDESPETTIQWHNLCRVGLLCISSTTNVLVACNTIESMNREKITGLSSLARLVNEIDKLCARGKRPPAALMALLITHIAICCYDLSFHNNQEKEKEKEKEKKEEEEEENKLYDDVKGQENPRCWWCGHDDKYKYFSTLDCGHEFHKVCLRVYKRDLFDDCPTCHNNQLIEEE